VTFAGHLALYGALAAAGWIAVGGDRRAVRAALWAVAALTATATALLGWALVTNDFSLSYVAASSRRGASAPYRLAGLWGGMAGSLLLWTAVLGAVGLVAARRDREVRAVFGWLVAGFVLVLLRWADPFDTLPAPALDGAGLQPILEHPAMLYHPLLVYLGLGALAAPFARTIVALRRGPGALDRVWLDHCRRGATLSWVVLVMAMVAGAHWAYAELGWGGYWAWDPVENTALLPWLAVSAFLHWSVRLREGESRATVTGPALVLAAFVLGILGTLLTRSGSAPSVHSFAQDDAIGRALLALLAIVVAVAVWTLCSAFGRRRVTQGAASLRQNALGAQMGLVVAALAVVLAGTVYPVVARRTVAVGGHYFAAFVGPIAVLVLGLVAVGPQLGRPDLLTRLRVPALAMVVAVVLALVAGWGSSPFALGVAGLGAFAVTSAATLLWREHRGGHLAHVGFAVLLMGVAGTTTARTATATLAPGESTRVGGYEVRNDGAVVVAPGGFDGAVGTVRANLTVTRGGSVVAHLHPEVEVYRDRATAVAVGSLRSTPLDDVQVLLHNADDAGRALIVVHVTPLMVWVWWGGLLMAAGGAWAMAAPRLSGRTRGNAVRDHNTEALLLWQSSHG